MKRGHATMSGSAMRRGAIVTGGSSGVGVAIVASLLRADPTSKVFVTGQKPLAESPLQKLLDGVGTAAAERVRYATGDTSDEEVVSKQFQEAIDFFDGAPPRALFLNAGIGGGRYPLEEFSVERFDALFRVNVRGVFLWLRAALPALKAHTEGGSQIVVTSSVAALKGIGNGGPYAATKFAVNGLVLSLREELKAGAPHVKAALVCPGPIDTPWWGDVGRGGRIDPTAPPPERMLSPESVAASCMMLVQQDATSDIERIVLEPSTVDADAGN